MGRSEASPDDYGISGPQAVIWLGGESDLLRGVSLLATVYQVYTPQAAIEALGYGMAAAVVFDPALPGLDAAALTADLRRDFPGVALIEFGPALSSNEADRVISPDIAPNDLLDVVRQAVSARRQSHASLIPYAEMQHRLHHLEGLIQMVANAGGGPGENALLSNLRQVARVAMDADEIAVLLADPAYTDLSDALHLGVIPAYLDVCRGQFCALPLEQRLVYLGSEVLLRVDVPESPPPAWLVREAQAAGAWSYMRLPLVIDERLTGFVALFSSVPGRFDGAHLQLARLFAAEVAAAVRHVRLIARLNQAEQRQQAVTGVARLIADDLALDGVLSRIANDAVQLVEGRWGAVLLVQLDGSLAVSAVSNNGSESPDSEQAARVVQSGQPAINSEPDRILFGVPLAYCGRVVGVFQVAAAPALARDDQAQQIDVLMTLASQAAIAIAKAQLYQRAEQDRQQLRTIMDHTPAVVVVCSAEGRVELANREAKRMLAALGLESIQGKYLPELLRTLLPHHTLTPDILDRRIEVNLGPLGEHLVNVNVIRRPDGSVDRYMGVGHDVTEHRRAGRLRSELIQILSHDLRNPLGLARGSFDLLAESDLKPEERRQLEGMVASSLERMEQLIQDVVDLEMAGSLGQQSAAPYNLSALVKRVVSRSADKAESQGVALHYEERQALPHLLRGHAVLVGQAIDNLVNNAIKYTPQGGRVDVTLDADEDYAVILVQDTGYGIPAEHLPHIFEQFFRVPDKRTRHIQGSGLGLSLVEAIARAHGGFVRAESEVGSGSLFTLGLPLKEQRPTQAPENHLVSLDLSRMVKSVL